MRTRSSSNLPVESSHNPTSSNPKRRNRRRSKQPFILEESPIDTMADQRTMAELLRTPTEGYAEAIVVPLILAEQFELKHSLINMMTSNQLFGLEKDNPHDHIRVAHWWLKKEPPHSILTWDDLFDESFHEAWDRYKDLLRACPHHGFTKLHQLDTFYNALNPADQDSLNSAAGGNLLERRTQDVLAIIENKSKCLAADGNTFFELWDNIQGYVSTAAVNYNQGNFGYRPSGVANQIRPSSFAQPYVQNNQIQFSQPQGYNRRNNFNQDKSYQTPTQQNQVVPLSELEKIKRMNEANMKVMQTQINNVKNELRNETKNSIQASMSNQTNELKNMMASFFQMNTASTLGSGPLPSNTIANPKGELKAITTRSGIVLDGPSVPIPPPFINLEEDERVEETLTDQDLAEYTIKVPPPLLHINITLADALILIPKYQKMLKALLFNKEKLLELENTPLNEICSVVILKKLPEKLGDPGKFLIPCGFSELKLKALADLANFVIVDYESDPRFPLILVRPFLRTARALIDVHGEEMILRDGYERLTLNMRHGTSSYSNQPQKESINMINIYDDSCEDFLNDLFTTNHQSGNPTFSSHLNLTSPKVNDDIFELEGDNVLINKLINLDSTIDLPLPYKINSLSGSTTSSSPNHLLEEFADKLALITFPSGNDDLPFDMEYDLKEIKYLLNHDPIKEMDSILKDLLDEDNLVNLNDNLVDTMPEMFTNEHALDYSSPPLYDEYDDDLFAVDDFLLSPEYDSFLFEDFSKVDAFPSTNNKDKVFNPGILIQENLFKVINRVAPYKNVKKIAISHASLILEDFDPPLSLHELPFHKEVFGSKTLLSFSSENEEKVFKPKILASKGVHSFLLLEISHRGPKVFKIIKILESPMNIFPWFCGENIHILDVPCLHFYPP
nr:hypothetical protein [Tanacetum cinerariifolium]